MLHVALQPKIRCVDALYGVNGVAVKARRARTQHKYTVLFQPQAKKIGRYQLLHQAQRDSFPIIVLYSKMRSLFFAVLLIALLSSLVEAGSENRRRPTNRKWKNRGQKRRSRQLHYDHSYGQSGKGGDGLSSAGRDGGFFSSSRSSGGGKGGKGNHFHTPGLSRANGDGVYGPGTAIYGENPNGYTIQSSELAYTNKCDAAEAGAEFKTSSYVPVYYEYEVVTSSTRDAKEIADIIDKACQHFLAVWMVDCDTYDGGNRQRQRKLLESNVVPKLHRATQMTLAPIVGVGVGDWDTVLGLETSTDKCTTKVANPDLGQACYKVIGSLLVYLDETMQVTPNDVQTLALETLTVGMNYGTTDFTQLDQDIYELQFIQGYGKAPEEKLQANSAANQRPWDTSNQETASAESTPAPVKNTGRSGGAKFGIAFASLLCIAIAAFLATYLFKNRDQLLRQNDGAPKAKKRRFKNLRKHFNLDDETQVSTRYDPQKARVVVDDSGSHGEMNITFRSFAASQRSPDAESVATRPLSPDVETPPPPTLSEVQNSMMEESNIFTPCSDISVMTEPTITPRVFLESDTPDDHNRIRVNLSKEKIRRSARKTSPKTSEYVSHDRSYMAEDTVNL